MCKRARVQKEEEVGLLCLSRERRQCDWGTGSTESEGGLEVQAGFRPRGISQAMQRSMVLLLLAMGSD